MDETKTSGIAGFHLSTLTARSLDPESLLPEDGSGEPGKHGGQTMKHTKGPWIAEPNGGDDPDPTIRCISAGDELVATAEMIWHDVDWDVEQQEANAKLIAAAPDLLEAAQITNKVLTDFITHAPPQGVMVGKPIQTAFLMLRDAIATATGNSE
ncbi:MAG: hypothetical protein U9P11_06395 [Pseudomonadota bacterium]|nr:hypothetical protein [Pseudomonadota bacterium]